MKKFISILTILLFSAAMFAQNGQRLTFTPTTNDSIVGAATKYCTLANPITGRWNGVIEVYITPSISSSDSTHVWVEGSQNGTTWYKITNLGNVMASTTTGTTMYGSNAVTVAAGYDYKCKMGTTAAGFVWPSTWYFNFPYYRIAVQHFKAATSVKITRASIYLKR